MKIIILAAGRGSRLGETTKDKPKCMIQLGGKSLIERAIKNIEEAGFQRKDIGIVTGYKSDMIQIEGVRYFYNENWESTNMFFSLTMAKEWLGREDVIVCYSDILFSSRVLRLLANCKKDVAVTYYTEYWMLWKKRFENPLDDLETFKIDKENYLTEIGKRTGNKEDIEGQYMGLIKFSTDGWGQVENTIKEPLQKPIEKLDMTTLLQGMLDKGYQIYAIKTEDLWLECDTEKDVKVYMEDEFIKSQIIEI